MNGIQGFKTYWRKSPRHKWVQSLEVTTVERRDWDMQYCLDWLCSIGYASTAEVAYQNIVFESGMRSNDLVDRDTKMDYVRKAGE